MNVVIDNQSGFTWKEDPPDVLTAVALISDFLRKRGRAILSVKTDGSTISPESLVMTLQHKPMGDVALLEVTSEDVAALAGDSLNELEQVLPELSEACHRLSEVFQGESPDDGYEPFHHLAEIWRTVKEREALIANALGVELDAMEVNGTPIGLLHEELNAHLHAAAKGIETRDCVLLGDLLEYELAPRAEAEAEIVALLRSHIPGR